MRRWVTAIAALLMASGCSVNVAFLKLAADRTPSAELLDSAVSQGWREGQSCRIWVLGVPSGLPQIDEAMRAALAPVNGAFMRDMTVYSEHPVYVLFGWHCYRVRGEVFSPAH